MELRERVHARVAPMIDRVRAGRPSSPSFPGSLPLAWPAWAERTGVLRPRLERAWSTIADRWPSLFEAPRRERRYAPPSSSPIGDLLVDLEPSAAGAEPLDPASLDPAAAGPTAEDSPASLETPDAPDAPGCLDAPAIESPTELLETLGTASAWEARRDAAEALGAHAGDVVVDALIRAVRDPSAEVAIAAVASLARQTDPRAAADLAEVLRDTAGFVSPYTRAAAVGAIAACQGLAALAMLIDTLHDGDVEVSIAAVLAVAAIAPAESGKRLLALLEDRSGYYHPAVRLATAEALQQNGTLNAERALWLLSTETDDSVRTVLSRSAHEHA